MEHINDSELLEHVAGRLPEAKSREFRQHIAECSECESRYRSVAEVWDSLDRWQVDTTGHEIADRVMAQAAKKSSASPESQTRTRPLIWSFGARLRVAAAILLAIGGGHLLGKYSLSHNTPTPPVLQDEPKYVAALGFEWSSDLMWAVLEDDDATAGEAN
jgi:anti-sigma factor RsiW